MVRGFLKRQAKRQKMAADAELNKEMRAFLVELFFDMQQRRESYLRVKDQGRLKALEGVDIGAKAVFENLLDIEKRRMEKLKSFLYGK